MSTDDANLWPPLADAELGSELIALRAAKRLRRGPGDNAKRLLDAAGAPEVSLQLDPLLGAQHYCVFVDGDGARIAGGDEAALGYGALTFLQWLAAKGRREGDVWRVPALRVEDGPAIATRGVMLDVSRDRVPTLETLYALVERLAALKINQLQIYMEHTFAYAGHEAVWREASPLTPDEVRALDAFCRARRVELIPNQNSLGHFHRWLIHEGYRPLAECPQGIEHPFSQRVEPYGLCATDERVFTLLADLYDQLFAAFSAETINVGLDEAFDLGVGRSAAALATRGKEGLFFDYLRRVHALVSERGRAMQVWADMFEGSVSAVAALPDDVTALAWGYSATHDFDAPCAALAAGGKRFYVCPGTSSWNSLLGRNSVALENLERGARAARAHGARGFLITDWGDNGHLQPLPTSYFGLVAGAALGWAPDVTLTREDVARALSRHIFDDAAGGMGEALARLGDAHERCGPRLINSAYPFNFLVRHQLALAAPPLAGCSEASLRACEEELDAGLEALASARTARDDGALVARELRWAARLLQVGCRLGRARLAVKGPLEAVARSERAELARALRPLVDEHEALWLARSRPGGMLDSRGRLEGALKRLER